MTTNGKLIKLYSWALYCRLSNKYYFRHKQTENQMNVIEFYRPLVAQSGQASMWYLSAIYPRKFKVDQKMILLCIFLVTFAHF